MKLFKKKQRAGQYQVMLDQVKPFYQEPRQATIDEQNLYVSGSVRVYKVDISDIDCKDVDSYMKGVTQGMKQRGKI